MAVSEATLMGNLIGIELQYSQAGNAYCRGRLAVSKGPDSEESQWYDFVAFGDLAQNIDESFKAAQANGSKSLRVVAKGKLDINYYEKGQDSEGQPIRRTSVQLIAEDVGVSMKYAQITNVARGYNSADTGSTVSQAPAMPEPVARNTEDIEPGEAPF